MIGNIFANDHCRFEISRGMIPEASELRAIFSNERACVLPDMFFAGASIAVKSSRFHVLIDADAAVSCYTIVPDKEDRNWNAINPPNLHSKESRRDFLGKLKVKHAAQWALSVTKRNLSTFSKPANYDWTYTTTYWGSIFSHRGQTKNSGIVGEECRDDFLPAGLLRNTSFPIRFHYELPLWEDELADNGHSRLSSRIRVMDDFFYILISFDLHVEGVLDSRRLETRIFHAFDSDSILREFRWIENGLEAVSLRVQQRIYI